MTNKERLKQVRLVQSPITNKTYICFVKDNLITEKVELTKDELREFCYVSALGLFDMTGATIEHIESKNKKILTISIRERKDEN